MTTDDLAALHDPAPRRCRACGGVHDDLSILRRINRAALSRPAPSLDVERLHKAILAWTGDPALTDAATPSTEEPQPRAGLDAS